MSPKVVGELPPPRVVDIREEVKGLICVVDIEKVGPLSPLNIFIPLRHLHRGLHRGPSCEKSGPTTAEERRRANGGSCSSFLLFNF